MNFQQLEYILAVQREGHFGKAAIACNITQATLSAMVKRLELELEFDLFDRTSHPIRVTEKGHEVLAHAQKAIQLRDDMLALKYESATEIIGPLRLGVIPTIASTLMPLVLPAIIQSNKSLELNVVELTTEEIVNQLNSHQIDVGILSTPLPLEWELPGEEVLYHEALYVYGMDTKGSTINIADLKSERVWLLEKGHCFRNQSMSICDLQAEYEHGALNFQSNSFDTLLNLSDQFGGFTLVPELYVKQLPSKRQQRCKRFASPVPVREVSLVAASPGVHKQAMGLLTATIQSIIPQLLMTKSFKNHELDIVSM